MASILGALPARWCAAAQTMSTKISAVKRSPARLSALDKGSWKPTVSTVPVGTIQLPRDTERSSLSRELETCVAWALTSRLEIIRLKVSFNRS